MTISSHTVNRCVLKHLIANSKRKKICMDLETIDTILIFHSHILINVSFQILSKSRKLISSWFSHSTKKYILLNEYDCFSMYLIPLTLFIYTLNNQHLNLCTKLSVISSHNDSQLLGLCM